MKKTTMTRILIVFAILAAVGIFVPTIMYPHTDGGVSGWVYDFQGLIGGGLALIAAAVTIMQMQSSDEEQAARHREQIGLQVRNDNIAIQNFKNDVPRSLRDQADAIKEFVAMEGVNDTEIELTPENAVAFIWAMIAVQETLRILDEDRTMKDCGHLFSPKLRATMAGCHVMAEMTQDKFGKGYFIDMTVKPDMELLATQMKKNTQAQSWFNGLEQLQRELAEESEKWAAMSLIA
ncbi:hypothetical protein GGQ64_004602 [Rhizobium azooxidifex]|uniref:Uncharacterized protein n=1 Tax=Mycoplana azooxidifex TaxID=1636188 RepID=A0A7W6DEV8_9HYPH|nr:hypothetical protein [Mycoplana azooxidifex]MBB3979362.1 hypothetical protein [Mycoplana azooxidifex]